MLLIGTIGTNFNEISSKIRTFSFKKMHLKMLSAIRLQCAKCRGINSVMVGDVLAFNSLNVGGSSLLTCHNMCKIVTWSEICNEKALCVSGWGLSRVVVTFNRVDGSFNLFKDNHEWCLNYLIFSNLGLCAACWACFMCHHELRRTSECHPFCLSLSIAR